MVILILTGIFVLHVNFANTGCLIYPIKKLCFSKFSWAMSEHEINRMSKHFEVWSKAGHTPNSRVENPEEYIKGINWVGGWFKNYFFNKVSDTLLGIIAMRQSGTSISFSCIGTNPRIRSKSLTERWFTKTARQPKHAQEKFIAANA